MRFLILLFISLITFGSCTTYQDGAYQNSIVLNQPNYKYVKKVSVDAKLTYVFGFGGNKKAHLYETMKETLYANAGLVDNQDIANVIVSKNLRIFPFVAVYKVRMSGDVIEWTAGGLENTRSEVIKKKILMGEESNASTRFKIDRINEFSVCANQDMITYEDIFSVSVNDIIYYGSEKEYGIVDEVKEKGVIVEFYNANGVLWKRSMIKVEYLTKIECKETE